MWTWEQFSGKLFNEAGTLVGEGYSGKGAGKNNPLLQNIKDTGPLPCGHYTIEAPINSPTHGPFAMPLVPDVDNNMFGRSLFLIHGDSIEHPGEASEGCIILPRAVRDQIWVSDDHRLVVVSGVS